MLLHSTNRTDMGWSRWRFVFRAYWCFLWVDNTDFLPHLLGECYELALWQSRQFSWRLGSMKALVMIGDDLPHDPHFPGNVMQLDWNHEVAQLQAEGVKIYGVWVSTDPDDANYPEYPDFYRTLASRTGGEFLTLDSFSTIHETMLSILYREAGDHQLENWVKSSSSSASGPDGVTPHVYLTNNMKELSFTTQELLRIHNAIHDKDVQSVEIANKNHAVTVGRAGCRFVRIEGITFVEQNKNKASQYARMAVRGKKITWIVKCGEWYVGTLHPPPHRSPHLTSN